MLNIAEIIEQARAYESRLPEPKAALSLPLRAEIAGWIDHTLLKPEATAEQIEMLCREARDYNFFSVCVNPFFVPLAASLLKDSPVRVCVVVAFPLGALQPSQKVLETLMCLQEGAREIDMVLNIGALKGQDYGLVYNEIQAVSQVAHHQGAIVKVIFETALLSRQEKILACLLSKAAGADFVKTSTGFGPGGATVEDVDLMYRVVGPEMGVKASGGIRDYKMALEMIRAGASRLGTSSGVKIVKEAISQEAQG